MFGSGPDKDRVMTTCDEGSCWRRTPSGRTCRPRPSQDGDVGSPWPTVEGSAKRASQPSPKNV